MDQYTAKIIKYINNQKYIGKLEDYTKILTLKSSSCGDYNDIYIKVENNIIKNISYENSGCALNIATLEIICEYLINKNINELNLLTKNKISEILDYPEHKNHCVELTLDTLKTF